MTTKETLVQLALGTLSDNDKINLAKDTKSKKLLKILSTYENWYIKYHVACNLNTPIDTLEVLSKDKNSTVSGCAMRVLLNIRRSGNFK